jgi:hypothetical protein
MAAIDFPNSPSVGATFTAGNSSYRWTGVAWVSNNLSSVTWTDVLGKPTTFPPSAHTHVIADTTGLQTALDGKAASSHTHLLAQITDYVAPDLSGKQDVVSGVSSTEIGYLDGVTSAIQTQLNGKAASSHTHAISDTTGLQTALDGKVDEVNGAVTTASTSLNVVRNITLSTSAPTGGADGDVWLVYTP